MDYCEYFDPVHVEDLDFFYTKNIERIGHIISVYGEEGHFPSLDNVKAVLIGVGEDRKVFRNVGCGFAPDQIRKYFYRLFPHKHIVSMADCGNLKLGYTPEDTYAALADVCASFISRQIIPIVLGGSQDITFGMYHAYAKLGQIMNLFTVDKEFDIGEDETTLNSQSFLGSIIRSEPNYLLNYTNVGYQTYLVDHEAVELMNNMSFDVCRLGVIQSDIAEVEPLVRNADLVSIDLSAVRQSDAPGNAQPSPHGFYGEELCSIARHAGLSDKLSSIGFFEVNPDFDQNGQTSHLVAQAIWYFIEGVINRKNDLPYKDSRNYRKFHVTITNSEHCLTFYKSKISDRWWIEVPCSKEMQERYQRHYLVPCSYKDYEAALAGEIPQRWLRACNKMN